MDVDFHRNGWQPFLLISRMKRDVSPGSVYIMCSSVYSFFMDRSME